MLVEWDYLDFPKDEASNHSRAQINLLIRQKYVWALKDDGELLQWRNQVYKFYLRKHIPRF